MATITYEPIKLDIDQVKEVYVELSALIYTDMDKQYKESKIHGSHYATTWAMLMNGVISSAMQTIAQLQMDETDADRCIKYAQCEEIALKSAREECMAEADCGLKDAQKSKVTYETSEILPTQKSLYVRQTEGFDDNVRQKMFEAQINSWAMMFSSGMMGDSVPCIIANDAVTSLYNGMIDGVMPPNVTEGDCTITPPA